MIRSDFFLQRTGEDHELGVYRYEFKDPIKVFGIDDVRDRDALLKVISFLEQFYEIGKKDQQAQIKSALGLRW